MSVPSPLLVDSHCHLDYPDFADELDEVVARAGEAGVGSMLTICTRISAFADVRAIAGRFDNVTCSVGVHPHEAAAESEQGTTTDRLVALAADPKVVGIGETGLDYYYEHSPREAQRALFRVHIAAARESGLPLIVHTREADGDTVDILKEEMSSGPFKGVIHCFSTGPEVAEAALKMGFYISFSGIVTFNRAEALREIAKSVPLERLLVETDAPYLAPVPRRGKRNEPAYVAHTAARLAEVLGLEAEELARATTANFHALFAKAPPPPAGAP